MSSTPRSDHARRARPATGGAEPRHPGAIVGVAGGVTAGIMVVALVVSLASLVFSGDLAVHAPIGVGLMLAGAAVMNLVFSRSSSMEGAVAMPQDATSAVVASALVTAAASAGSPLGLATALVVVAIGTALTGAVMLGLGGLRLGGLVRFVPYPVMGGFLAGTGWLLVFGAAGLATGGFRWSLAAAGSLAASLGLGLALALAVRSRPPAWVFPSVLVAAFGLFHVLLAVTGTSQDEARQLGLLPPVAFGWTLPPGGLGTLDWSAVATALPVAAVVPLVATLALLLNVGGLELVSGRDADLDRELRAAGWANLAAVPIGAVAGYHALGASALAHRLGARTRTAPLAVAAVCVAVLAGGPPLVASVPVPLVGAVLAMLGFSFLGDWLVEGRRRMPSVEYALMAMIVGVVAWRGFLAGVAVGMAAALVLFTIRYSRIDPVRHSFTLDARASSLERPSTARSRLRELAPAARVVELQGFLFFGTAYSAVAGIQASISTGGLRCLVLDLRRVEGLDSTALLAFAKLARAAEEADVHLVFSNVGTDLCVALARVGVVAGPGTVFAPDLDHALEWCETALLAWDAEPSPSPDPGGPLERFLPEGLWRRLEPHLDRIELAPGQVLADIREASDCVFIVDIGRVAAEVPVDDDRWQRVRSAGPGHVLGEMSLYLGGGRTARLRAESTATVFRLSPAAIADLERTDPGCAIAFHRAVGAVLAERLTFSNDFVRALAR